MSYRTNFWIAPLPMMSGLLKLRRSEVDTTSDLLILFFGIMSMLVGVFIVTPIEGIYYKVWGASPSECADNLTDNSLLRNASCLNLAVPLEARSICQAWAHLLTLILVDGPFPVNPVFMVNSSKFERLVYAVIIVMMFPGSGRRKANITAYCTTMGMLSLQISVFGMLVARITLIRLTYLLDLIKSLQVDPTVLPSKKKVTFIWTCVSYITPSSIALSTNDTQISVFVVIRQSIYELRRVRVARIHVVTTAKRNGLLEAQQCPRRSLPLTNQKAKHSSKGR